MLFHEAFAERHLPVPEEIDGLFSGAVQASLSSLPMGWKWSVALAQHTHERLLAERLCDSEMLRDGSPVAPFDGVDGVETKCFAYIDDG